MISLIFLVCTLNQECKTISPEYVFTNMDDCERVAITLMEENQAAEDRKELPLHTADFVCYYWGEKA